MKAKFHLFVIIIVFPLIISVITHFGYISGYTEDVFSENSFTQQYDEGIYKYRVLSKYLLLETNKILSQTKLDDMDNMLSRNVKFFDESGKLSFYFSYFVINSIFFILSALIFYFILKKNIFYEDIDKISLSLIVYAVVIPIFQYVVVPYDYSSYFFNNLIILIFLNNIKNNKLSNSILLFIVVIIATLNRETSALAISLIATIALKERDNLIESLKLLLAPALAFITTYIALRLWFGFDTGLIHKFTLLLNLISPLNLFGIFTGVLSVYLLFYFANEKSLKRLLINYLLLSSPYIVVSLIGGITFEIRLWVPILLNLTIILLYYKRGKMK